MNSIGIGISSRGLMRFWLGSWWLPVKGMVCSTNFDASEYDSAYLFASCTTKMRGNNEFDGNVETGF
jgi:hypothetical protein